MYQIHILFAFLFFCSHALAQEPPLWHVHCIGVTDGDTIKVLTTRRSSRRAI
jgi:hypothetical protein